MMDYNKFPKIELHVHLDGSVRPTTASELLNEDIEKIKEQMIAKNKCVDLNEYLEKFSIPIKIMQTKENLKRVAYELALDLQKDGVIYAEVRFAPLKHINLGLTLEDVVDSVLQGLRMTDLKTNLILCMMRNDSLNDNYKVIELALKYQGNGVCAIDLAGAEAIYKTKNFEELFNYAKQKQIPFTIHAGEADGYDSIKAAIEFGSKRLGHGIRAIDSNELLKEIKNKGILLEVCPTSNVQTNAVKSYLEHPIRKLYEYGIKVCINTDNRTVSNINLTDEYKYLSDNFNFSKKDFETMNINAINASFLSNAEKQTLTNKFNSLL